MLLISRKTASVCNLHLNNKCGCNPITTKKKKFVIDLVVHELVLTYVSESHLFWYSITIAATKMKTFVFLHDALEK